MTTHTTINIFELHPDHISAYQPAPDGGSIVWMTYGPTYRVTQTPDEIDALLGPNSEPDTVH